METDICIDGERYSTVQKRGSENTGCKDKWWTFYQQEIKRTSIASLKGNIKEIRDSFGLDIKVVNIDPKYVQNYLDNLDCSRNKKERNKSMLNLVFDYAVDLDIIKDNPARRAKLPRIKKTLEDWKKIEEKYLEEDEIKPLLKELFRRPSTYRAALLAEFMSLNGCRIGEAVSLEPENRDFETKILQLHGTYDHTEGYRNGEKTTPKTNASYRETFMTKREMEIIEELEFMNELEKIPIHGTRTWAISSRLRMVFQSRPIPSTWP